MNENELLEKLECLNKEKQQIKQSREFKLGQSLLKFKKNLVHLNFKAAFKILRDKMASKKIRKFSSNECDMDIKNNKVDYKTKKIAIYTCVVGDYDNLQVPLLRFENVDYYLFTDNVIKYSKYSSVYKIVAVPQEILDKGNIIANRYLKFHPHEFLKDYDYTMYFDGNVRVIADVRKFVNVINKKTGIAMHVHRERNCIYDEAKACILLRRGNKLNLQKQMEGYQKEGFPKKYGMNEATVIVCDNHSEVCQKLLGAWYDEFLSSNSLRDQIAWPYVLWKNHYKIQDVGCLGKNIYENYKIEIVSHN